MSSRRINGLLRPILLLALLNFFTPSSLMASVEGPAMRFTKVENIPASLSSIFGPLKKSVHLLQSLGDGECTGNFVSKSGLFLTARHCVKKCLVKSKVLAWHTKPDSGIDYFVRDDARLGKATCEVLLDGKPEVAVVEATSPGLLYNLDEKSFSTLYPEEFRKMEKAGFTARGDFALLRLAPGREHLCLAAPDQARYLPGSSVYTMGYPAATSRGDGFDSDGKTLYASAGKILSGFAGNACASELTERQLAWEEKEHNDPAAFLSTLDGVYGSSGSSVVSQDGKSIGVLMQVFHHGMQTQKKEDDPLRRFCEGSLKALRSDQIWELLEPFPALRAELSCP